MRRQQIMETSEQQADSGSSEPNNDSFGRAKAEWLTLLNSAGGIVMIVLAASNWGKCEAIGSLQYMVLFFGIIHTISCFVKFLFRTETKKSESKSDAWVHVDSVLGISLIGCAIWGAAITYGNTSKVGDECSGALFYPGIIASSICLAIVVVVLLVICLRPKICGKIDSEVDSPNNEDKNDDVDA